MLRRVTLPLLLSLAFALPARAAETRPLQVNDIFQLKEVGDPRLSPDGKWVAYTVTALDAEEDKSDTDVWMVPAAGGEAIRVTTSKESESSPRWSPDDRYLAFLSSREAEKTQVWLLNRQGGEAERLTDYSASVLDLAWSPDSKQLALVVSDPDPDEPATDKGKDDAKKAKTAKPIVTRRLQFKNDGSGYLREIRSHLHVFDVKAKTSVQVTTGPYDDSEPAWSPDGRTIAFTSKRSKDPDLDDNFDLFLVAPAAGETPRSLTSSLGADSAPAFSPDGKWIAYVEGGPEPADGVYPVNHVAVVPAAGGAPRALTGALDRNVSSPRFSFDGRALLFILEDQGSEQLARVPLLGGAIERVVAGERAVKAFEIGRKGETVVLESQPSYPPELSAVTASGLVRLTKVNDALLSGIKLGTVRKLQAKSTDGTRVDYFLVLPPDAAPGVKLPTYLRPHGGPAEQFAFEFEFRLQIFAAHGYAVVAPNYRGSTGYGKAFGRAIWADWGNKDLADILASVDDAIARGVADPDRLAVGGWSYGGMLTDYAITRTSRFKAAVSGASEANYLMNYGLDDLQRWWEVELGLPWKDPQAWIRISPFFEIEKVKTPTLVMCGAADMRVPLPNSEQLYAALRRLGVETELVIYPGEYHEIGTPSYQKDRYERWIAWFDRFLKPEAAAASAPQ